MCFIFTSHASSVRVGNVQYVDLQLKILIIIGGTAIIFCTDEYSPRRINPNNFCDPLIFSLVPPAGQICTYLVNYLICHLSHQWLDNLE